jgi:malonyl-CoA decarboxylase
LSHDLPRLDRYATLSPIPGFRVWLDRRLTRQPETLHVDGAAVQLSPEMVRRMVDDRSWRIAGAPRPPQSDTLVALCARYFAERHADGQPIDPVARFHLRNGARLDRINWLGDVSRQGIRQSLGLMVNYRYVQDDIDRNHEAYAKERELVVSESVCGLMRRAGASIERVRAVADVAPETALDVRSGVGGEALALGGRVRSS